MKRVLLLLPTTGYRNDDFLAAATTLGVEIVAAANYCHQLAPEWGLAPILALEFDRPAQAADTALRELDRKPDAVLAVDDATELLDPFTEPVEFLHQQDFRAQPRGRQRCGHPAHAATDDDEVCRMFSAGHARLTLP